MNIQYGIICDCIGMEKCGSIKVNIRYIHTTYSFPNMHTYIIMQVKLKRLNMLAGQVHNNGNATLRAIASFALLCMELEYTHTYIHSISLNYTYTFFDHLLSHISYEKYIQNPFLCKTCIHFMHLLLLTRIDIQCQEGNDTHQHWE